MTPRERWLAALRLQPVDRLPFWPKLDGAYPRAQKAIFRDMDVEAIHDWIGSDKHTWIEGCVKERRRKTAVESAEKDCLRTIRFHTAGRTLERTDRFDAASQAWRPVKFTVQNRDDVLAMEAWYADCEVELDREALARGREQAGRIGMSAVTAAGLGESPLMHWIEWLAGVENGHLMLADHGAEVEALFAAMHRVLVRRAEILAEHWPGDLIYATENTSTTLISPAQYEKYCLPHIRDYGAVLAGADRLFVLHMCGHLKKLLPMLSGLPVAGFEAFTSPTLGNTTLADGRADCPDKCLIGGTNATLWLRPAAEIIARIKEDLDALPHHRGIVVTSAGVMPPFCAPETIRAVCDWVKGFPARM